MKIPFKTLFTIGVTILATYFVLNWYFSGKVDEQRRLLRQEREEHSTVVEAYNKEIGDYTYRLGKLSDDLKNEKRITDEQRTTISELQKDLDTKVQEVHTLAVQIDTLSSSGQAAVVVSTDTEEKVYSVNEHLQGIRFALNLKHPQGTYEYTIAHDPITMELYVSREKGSELKVGSIRFPNNPYITVTSWEMFYDEDLRPWYRRIWDNVHLDAHIIAGQTSGIGLGAGYKSITVGPIFTEDGMNMGLSYRIK